MRGRGAIDWERPAWVKKWARQTVPTRAISRMVDIDFCCCCVTVLTIERGEGAKGEAARGRMELMVVEEDM